MGVPSVVVDASFLVALWCKRDLNHQWVLELMNKYADIPMSVADACLVRLTEILPEPLLLTTDSDFTIYRRFGRRRIPVRMP